MQLSKDKILTLDKYIDEALYNKKSGYYMNSNPFGKNGDYITSPNISILFSEMIATKTLIYSKNTQTIIANEHQNPIALQVGGSDCNDLKLSSKLAYELNYDPIALAVAWVLNNDAVTAPIISARNLKQLKPSLDSVKISLDNETYKLISSISPTPAPATDRLEEVSEN